MKSKIAIILLGALLVGAAPADNRKEIRIQDFSKEYVMIGTLLHPIGEYMTVAGDYFGSPAMTKSGLYVDAIMGMKFEDPPLIIHVDDRELGKHLEAGRRYQLRGFETGGYEGRPDDPQNPPTKEQVEGRQEIGPYRIAFRTVFHVTKAEYLGPVKGGTK